MSAPLTSRLTTQAGMLAASRALGQVLNALIGFVAVRQLTQGDFATFRQLYLLFITLVIITDLGFSESLYYFIPRRREHSRRLVLRAVGVIGLVQILVAGALVVFRGPIADSFRNPVMADFLLLLAVFLGFTVLTRLWEIQLIAEERVGLAAAVTGGFEALKVGLMLGVLWLAPGLRPVLWAMVAATAAKMAAFLWFLSRQHRAGESPVALEAGGHWSYAMALWIPGAINVIGMQAHQFIIGFSFTPEEFAVYSVACFQIPLMGVLGTSVGEVLLVRATQYRGEGRTEETYQVWQNACRKSFLVFLPVAIGLAVLAEPLIVTLFTRNYAASAPLFAVLVATLPLQATFHDAMLRACAAMRAYGSFYIARLVLGIGLGVAGAQWFGLMGVALSTFAALLIVNAGQQLYVAQMLRVPLSRGMPWPDLGRIMGLSAAAAAPAWFIARELRAWPLTALAAGLAAFGAVFLGLAWKSNLLRPEEKEAVAGLLGRLLKKNSGVAPGAEKETYA